MFAASAVATVNHLGRQESAPAMAQVRRHRGWQGRRGGGGGGGWGSSARAGWLLVVAAPPPASQTTAAALAKLYAVEPEPIADGVRVKVRRVEAGS